MSDTPRMVEVAAQTAAVIPLKIPRDAMREVMGPAIGELLAAVAGQGRTPTGPLFAHHHRIDPETFDFSVGVPVSAPIAADGRVVPGELPGGTVARTIHRGSYEGLGPAWGEFDAWLRAEGLNPAPDFWECYLVGPDVSPDPADWRTELNRPLLSSA